MKEAIALLINDIHISKDNISDFQKNWDEMCAICKSRGVPYVVVGGDMFTSRASQTLATLLTVKHGLTKLTSQGVFAVIANGNHDKVDQEMFEGYNHLWDGLSNIQIVNDYEPLYWDGCNFVLLVLAYFPENGSFLDVLDKAVEDTLTSYSDVIKSKSDIILYLHEGIHGALGDFDIEGEVPQEPLLGFKAVLCGHYHNRCKIKGTNIEYIGASRQHNFGEDEDKGYTILYNDGSYEFVKNEVNTRYCTIEIDAAEVDTFQLVKNDDRYRHKVKVKCSEKEAKLFEKQKLLDLGVNKVEVVTASPISRDISSSGIDEKYDKEGIKREYQNYCNENTIDCKLGMKYLEG